MRVKRLAVLTATLVVLGAGIVYASSPWGEYEGYSKVRVLMNNVEVPAGDVPGFVIGDSAVLPLRELSESLQAVASWDSESKTVSLYKPNVHMFVAKGIAKDDSPKSPFGKVSKGSRLDFVVAAQVDQLTTPIHSFKIDLLSPNGTVLRSVVSLQQEQRESFWYSWPLERVAFDMAGSYKVQFKIKLNEDQSYTTVSEKLIIAE